MNNSNISTRTNSLETIGLIEIILIEIPIKISFHVSLIEKMSSTIDEFIVLCNYALTALEICKFFILFGVY